MRRNYGKYINDIYFVMLLFNLLIILFYASFYLLTTKSIISNGYSSEFLMSVSWLPFNPINQFICIISLYFILVITLRLKLNSQYQLLLSIIEVILALLIAYSTYFAYTGILLLIFCDIVYNNNKGINKICFIIGFIFIYLFAINDVFSLFAGLPSINTYLSFLENDTRVIISVLSHLVQALSIVLFITYSLVYLGNKIQENEDIEAELSMINQVNKELKNYVAVSEKIGEDKERKRLSREIHDTLGHALTGIAAGVDACIAMIDINPDMTKKHLLVVSKVVREGINDVRNSLNKLRPGALEEGLKQALEKMIQEFGEVSDITINLNYQLNQLDFENTKEDIIFRLIQESITNALRHGGASQIDIDMDIEDDNVIIIIKDNGKGCKEIHYGYGLKQMQERLAIINGEVKYDGNDGFKTMVKIPIKRGESYD